MITNSLSGEAAAGNATVAVGVTVTFLRLERFDRLDRAPRPLPAGAGLLSPRRCEVGFYRYLYGSVGAPYVWWLRRSLSDAEITGILADPAVSIHVLYVDAQPAGFFELDRRHAPSVNLSYFGLIPSRTGQRLGTPLLHAAIRAAQGLGAKTMTVNTCTADHPRALPSYVAAGFQPVRAVREVWDVPLRLGLSIPDHLRV